MPRRRIEYDLKKQTDGEMLWLRRKAWGKTQAEAAKMFGVSRPVYWAFETGRRDVPADRRGVLYRVRDWPTLLPLARRRSGLTLPRIAGLAGMSVPTYLKREATGSVDLIRFWANRGFYA